jgi:hypothetical protein
LPNKHLLRIATLAALSSLAASGQLANQPEKCSIAVNVLDDHGNVIGGLAKEDFRVLLNGSPAKILDARYGTAPRRIVVLLDTSGSMGGERGPEKWKIARESVRDLLAQTPGDVPIAMLTFARTVTKEFDFPDARATIGNWLEESPDRQIAHKNPETALFDAILQAVKLLGTPQPGDAIYAITDGYDNASSASVGPTQAALLKSGTRLFAFVLGEPGMPGTEDRKTSFLNLIEASGGFAAGIYGHHRSVTPSWEVDYSYNQDARGKIDLYTKEVNLQISGFWTLDLAVATQDRGSKVKLKILNRDGKTRKDIFLTYPRLLPVAN